MQLTKTLTLALLPLLALATPTPSTPALPRDGLVIDYAAIQALRQSLYDAYGQTHDISSNVVSSSSALVDQLSGGVSDSFRDALKGYQEYQEKASAQLLALAEAVGGVSDSFKEADEAASSQWN
ncbi:hypothetical protein VE03_06379 [Pseudogymnoascus sp. 23342-1-I1]|nr:hypothetical protein VE03_06379 [Pseudogymnoascus sp. 23342-1-I1]